MEIINPRALDWLLEEVEVNAPIRYLTLRDIFDRHKGDSELESARKWVTLRALRAVKNFYE